MSRVTAEVFAELGVVILLFTVGLEVRLDDLIKVGPMAIAVGTIGFILPIIAGMAIGLAIGEEALAAALTGLALAATSIGITSRVLAEMGMLDRAFARVILGAAIVDDILALLAIGVLSGLAEGDLGVDTILTLVAGLAFVGVGLALAPLGRRIPRKVFVFPKFADTPVVPVFIIMFAGALLAQFVGLAAIIGAFVVGLFIAETPVREEVEHGFRSLLGIFAPFFFAVTGANIDMSALLQLDLLVIVLILAVMGVVTKLIGGIIGSWKLGKWNSVVVGLGMSPRGEVGIVVAALGPLAVTHQPGDLCRPPGSGHPDHAGGAGDAPVGHPQGPARRASSRPRRQLRLDQPPGPGGAGTRDGLRVWRSWRHAPRARVEAARPAPSCRCDPWSCARAIRCSRGRSVPPG